MAACRRKVLFTGHVQGVGFRFTACDAAQPFDVTGFVRNLPDGRVELVVEGEPPELDAFLAAISKAMGGRIRDTAITDHVARGEFMSFDIRH